jgi:transcriptional regulator with XRE-family HTH domain
MILLSEHSKAARGLLGWSTRDLAAAANLSADTISRFENNRDLKQKTIWAIRNALDEVGIHPVFGHSPGVTIRIKLSERVVKNGGYYWACERLGQQFRVRADKGTVDRYARLSHVSNIERFVAARVSEVLLPPQRKKPVRGVLTLSIDDLARPHWV